MFNPNLGERIQNSQQGIKLNSDDKKNLLLDNVKSEKVMVID
jgi:hypothetical protein